MAKTATKPAPKSLKNASSKRLALENVEEAKSLKAGRKSASSDGPATEYEFQPNR